MVFTRSPQEGDYKDVWQYGGAAVDVRTNRIAWRQQWVDTCYSGAVSTAGRLVFVGRNNGSVNATVPTFLHEGTQYVSVLASGTNLAPIKKSDGLWQFSLNGTTESLPRGSAGPTQAARRSAHYNCRKIAPDLASGENIFTTTCAVCHGEDCMGGSHSGVVLTDALTTNLIATTLVNGRNNMPAFGAMYSAEQVQDVAGYILQELIADVAEAR